MNAFRINDSYTVIPEKNMVNEVKLEPRLMKLLCLLTEHKGKVVSREKIIEDIWKGYGGGDEGLTQAISFLRKLFEDHDKKLIETVPKTGYIFNGDISGNIEASVPTRSIKKKNTILYIIAIAVVIAFVSIFLFTGKNENQNIAPSQPAKDTVERKAIAPVSPKDSERTRSIAPQAPDSNSMSFYLNKDY